MDILHLYKRIYLQFTLMAQCFLTHARRILYFASISTHFM